RLNLPEIPRPYRSPFGITGAALTVVIALWTMYYQFRDPAYVKGVYAALAWYLAGLAYFGLFGRHRLVLSPEERFAISKGTQLEHAEPETTTEDPAAVLPGGA
ncbi:MAG TPA: hypothetical protein VER11_35395, partial [Polyangiaceae bacterium]|nr:hypothetical protein [Polyangiaceae bacterium]